MMEFYCENSCQLTATLPKSSIIDIRMGSNYAFQTIELVKMEVRLRKSSRMLQCTAFLFLPSPTGESERSLYSGTINDLRHKISKH